MTPIQELETLFTILRTMNATLPTDPELQEWWQRTKKEAAEQAARAADRVRFGLM